MWEGSINKSPSAATKRAGIKAFLQCFIGHNSSISNLALSFIYHIKVTDFLTKDKAPDKTKLGSETCLLHNYSASVFKSVIAESRTIPAMDGSISEYMIAVIAPIDLPHNPIVETESQFLRYSIIIFRSSLSQYPKLMYSPSDKPHPT